MHFNFNSIIAIVLALAFFALLCGASTTEMVNQHHNHEEMIEGLTEFKMHLHHLGVTDPKQYNNCVAGFKQNNLSKIEIAIDPQIQMSLQAYVEKNTNTTTNATNTTNTTNTTNGWDTTDMVLAAVVGGGVGYAIGTGIQWFFGVTSAAPAFVAIGTATFSPAAIVVGIIVGLAVLGGSAYLLYKCLSK
jgi:hypothetical protein